jgi:DNA polymerase-3 subunit gamma/tau
MSYQVLARKWRPRVFGELVGQAHVVRALSNALDNERLHHAYLFTGTRGLGKTTLARILAKSLNCETGVTSTPCGQCSTCRSVDEGRFVDLLEVDAASRSKVDETRDLLDNVPFAPVAGRYKVYLIDEVHMFSGHSFNALLKTLEEPPPHVKFLLATTDPQKLPITVLSRCLQFNLKQLPHELIQGHLQHILGQEGVEFEAPALTLLARAAAGSMRDALSLLDQAIAFGAGRVGEADVRAMLGTLPEERYAGVIRALAAADARALLDAIAELAAFAPDFAAVLRALLGLLHRIALAQMLPEAISDADADADQVRELAGQLSPEDVQLYYQIGLLGQRDLPFAPDPRSGFEMVLLRMLAFRPEGPEGQIRGGSGQESKTAVAPKKQPAQTSSPSLPRLQSKESGLVSEPKPQPFSPSLPEPEPAVASSLASEVAPAPELKQIQSQGQRDDDWHQVTAAIAPALGGMATQLAEHCTIKGWAGDTLMLSLTTGAQRLASDKAHERLQRALQQYYGADVQIAFDRTDKQPSQTQSPAQRKAEERQMRQREAEESLAKNPYIQAMTQTFGAELIPESIRPGH